VDTRGRLIGMITEADLITAGVAPGPRSERADDAPRPPCTVADVMSTRVIAAAVDADLADIARIMLSAHLTRVPIIDDLGRLVGLISRRDLVRLLARSDDEIVTEVQQVIADRDGEPPSVTVVEGEVRLSATAAAVPDELTETIRSIPGVSTVIVTPHRA